MSSTPKRKFFATATIAVLLGVMTACASSGSGSSGGGSSASPAGLTDEQIKVGISYTGGVAGAADTSLPPVKIGFINVDGGVPSFPESAAAATIAAKFVNEQLGGVQKHPVEIVTCNIVQGDEDGQKCAQQFANDPSIQTVQLGMTVLGAGPIYSTIGQTKALTGQGTFNAIDLNNPGVNFYEAAGYSTGPGVVLYAHDYLKAKTLAVAYDGNDPGAAAATQIISKLGPQYGISVKAVPVSDASQWSTALISAGAQTADAILVEGSTSTCVPMAQAVQQIGATAPVMTFGFCQDSSVSAALGDYPKWTYIQPLKSPIGVQQPDVMLYDAVMDFYDAKANKAGGANGTFQMIISQVRALNQVGYDKLSPQTIRDAISSFTGPVFLGPETIKCGQYASQKAPSLCTTQAFPINYTGNGAWEDPTQGKGLDVGALALP